jgi:hypothetical protein
MAPVLGVQRADALPPLIRLRPEAVCDRVNMDFIGALAGVLVGALLQGASTWRKTSRAERLEVGVVLSDLLRLHRQTTLLRRHLRRRAKHAPEEGPDDMRAAYELRSMASYLHQFEKLHSAIEQAKKQIAGTDPVAALQLDGMRDTLRQLQEIKDSEITRHEYVQRLAAVTRDLEVQSNELKPIISRLATLHGLSTWLRVKRELKRDAAVNARSQEI